MSQPERTRGPSWRIFGELLADCRSEEPSAHRSGDASAERGEKHLSARGNTGRGTGADAASGDPERRGPLRLLGIGLAIVIGGLFVVLLIFGLLSKSANTNIDDSLARKQAVAVPPFRLAVLQHGALGGPLTSKLTRALTDGQVSQTELRGVPYVLNFWASWCVPCRTEAPQLERQWRQARREGVLFVGLNMQDVTDDARAFLSGFRIDYLNIRDPTNDTARQYGVTGVPETFFISRRGKVVGHIIGVATAADLRNGIAAASAGHLQTARQGGARKPTR